MESSIALFAVLALLGTVSYVRRGEGSGVANHHPLPLDSMHAFFQLNILSFY